MPGKHAKSKQGLLFCLAVLLLAGCVNERREREIGARMSAQINTQLPLVQDSVLNADITGLGQGIAAAGDRPRLDYHFYLINSAAVNAFALPGGYIYITRGLIERTHSTPELAAVLAHEIGHVAARHGVAKVERYLRTGSLVNFLYSTILGGEPKILRQNSLEITGALWSAHHSRQDEAEADRLGVKYLIRAGIDPSAMVTLLESLLDEEQQDQQQPDSNQLAAWFSSHPLTSVRIQEAREEIRKDRGEKPAEPPPAFPAYAVFLRRIESLPPTIDLY